MGSSDMTVSEIRLGTKGFESAFQNKDDEKKGFKHLLANALSGIPNYANWTGGTINFHHSTNTGTQGGVDG